MKKQEIIRDLMQKVRELDKERTNANYEYFSTRINNLMLKNKLEEKDKEIEELEHILSSREYCLSYWFNKNRHDICEEISKAIDEYIDTHRWKWETPDGKPKIVYIPNFTIRDILRKVEKGE